MLEARRRGHALLHYEADRLNWRDGRVTTLAHPVTRLEPTPGDHFALGDAVLLDLRADVDVVLMRRIRRSIWPTSRRRICWSRCSPTRWW